MKPVASAFRALLRNPSQPLALAALLVASLALPARAGMVLTGEHKPLDGSSQPMQYTASVDAGKVRLETTGGQSGLFIYRGDKGVFWIVNPAGKTYSEMTKADMEAMADQLNSAMKQMQEQLAKMPPEQRAMMEKMMPGMAGGSKEPKIAYKKTGAGKQGEWACDTYEMTADGVKRAELCVVAPGKLGLDMSDYQSITDLAKPFEKIAKDLQAMFPQPGKHGAPDGIPVKTTLFEDGKATSESTVKTVKKGVVALDQFELPKGLAKQDMPMGAPKAKKAK